MDKQKRNRLVNKGIIKLATQKDVGKEMILGSNSSFNINLLTGEVIDDLFGKKMTIILGPYEVKVKGKWHNAHPVNKEFVLVLHEKKLLRVINYFK